MKPRVSKFASARGTLSRLRARLSTLEAQFIRLRRR
jgi:hypothetical protein